MAAQLSMVFWRKEFLEVLARQCRVCHHEDEVGELRAGFRQSQVAAESNHGVSQCIGYAERLGRRVATVLGFAFRPCQRHQLSFVTHWYED